MIRWWTPLSVSCVCVFLAAAIFSQDDEKQEVDLVVNGEYIVTADDDWTLLRDGAVAVNDGKIVGIDTQEAIASQFSAKRSLPGRERIVMPGLVNGHTHAAMSILRGIADDRELLTWLNDFIFPAEVKYVDRNFVTTGTLLACWEMIRGGTTTFVDMYYFAHEIALAVESCGMRAMVSTAVIDQQSPDATDAAHSLQNAREFFDVWIGRNSRITPLLGTHAIYTLGKEQLIASRALASEYGVGITIHVSESLFEFEYSTTNYGDTSINFMDSIDFFSVPTIAAHVVYPTDKEISILNERRVGVIHNPTSNMKIASGISPVTKLIAAGVNVGLGTDGPASNNDLDMWEEMRLAAFLQKVSRLDAEALPAKDVLAMATRNGARAIGLGDTTGELVVGKRADLIQVDIADVHHVPMYDIYSHLVYVTDEQDVVSVVIDGNLVMEDGVFLTIEVDEVAEKARKLGSAIKNDLVGTD